MHQSISGAPMPPRHWWSISPPYQSQEWGFSKFFATWGLGICQPQCHPQAFGMHMHSYPNITKYGGFYRKPSRFTDQLIWQVYPPLGICLSRPKKCLCPWVSAGAWANLKLHKIMTEADKVSFLRILKWKDCSFLTYRLRRKRLKLGFALYLNVFNHGCYRSGNGHGKKFFKVR